jgi:acetolactate synthase regulatory subunit
MLFSERNVLIQVKKGGWNVTVTNHPPSRRGGQILGRSMEFQHYSGHSEIEKVVVSERTLEGVKMSLEHFMGGRFVKATNLISEKKN